LLVLTHEDLDISRFFGRTLSRVPASSPECVAALSPAGFSDRLQLYIPNQRSNLEQHALAVKLMANRRIAFSF